jgi:hypothetical protein
MSGLALSIYESNSTDIQTMKLSLSPPIMPDPHGWLSMGIRCLRFRKLPTLSVVSRVPEKPQNRMRYGPGDSL